MLGTATEFDALGDRFKTKVGRCQFVRPRRAAEDGASVIVDPFWQERPLESGRASSHPGSGMPSRLTTVTKRTPSLTFNGSIGSFETWIVFASPRRQRHFAGSFAGRIAGDRPHDREGVIPFGQSGHVEVPPLVDTRANSECVACRAQFDRVIPSVLAKRRIERSLQGGCAIGQLHGNGEITFFGRRLD